MLWLNVMVMVLLIGDSGGGGVGNDDDDDDDDTTAVFYSSFLVEISKAAAQRRPRSVSAVRMQLLRAPLVPLMRITPQVHEMPAIGLVASSVEAGAASPVEAARPQASALASPATPLRSSSAASASRHTGTRFY
jgi:hypothetical protein